MRGNAAHLTVLSLVFVAGCSSHQKGEPAMTAEPALGTLDDYMASDEGETYASAGSADDAYATYPATPTYGAESQQEPLAGLNAASPKYHTVAKGDTLYALARQYYGDQRRWKDIYEANRNMLSDPNKIRVGQRLLIP